MKLTYPGIDFVMYGTSPLSIENNINVFHKFSDVSEINVIFLKLFKHVIDIVAT